MKKVLLIRWSVRLFIFALVYWGPSVNPAHFAAILWIMVCLMSDRDESLRLHLAKKGVL